jgi:exopolysaccharide biosynthesis polyprenyl glycosylphosphotransferase
MNINFYKKYYGFFLSIIDLIIFYLSLLIVVVLRFQNNFSSQIIFDHLFAFTPLIILSIFLYFINNLYDYGFKLKGSDFVAFFGRTQFFILFIGVIYFYIIPIGLTPKTNLLLFWVLASLIIYFNHMFVSYKNPLEKINILFLQNTKLHSSIQKSINNNDFFGIKVFIYPETSDLDYLKDFVIQNNIQTIVLDDKKIPKEKLYSLLFDNINFQTFEAFYETIFRKIPVEVIEHDWFLEKINTNKYSLTVFIKRMFDVILSLLFLIITFPLWIIVIILIKLTSNGPVFYLSKRCGKNNKDIILYKFRTMQENARQSGPAWTLPNDKRITWIGQFLRRFYIDEWPQFINILKGDISFVGPRPEEKELTNVFKENINFYNIRHLVTPGLTGWAQINQKNTHSINEAQEKLKYDLFYIKNYSIWLDLYIIIKTLKVPFV